MNQSALVLLLIALTAANLPFLSDRILFVVIPKSGRKALGWRLLELVILYFVAGAAAYLLERNFGQVHVQRWEFYAITFCLFVVFGYPGFVWRYLWKTDRQR